MNTYSSLNYSSDSSDVPSPYYYSSSSSSSSPYSSPQPSKFNPNDLSYFHNNAFPQFNTLSLVAGAELSLSSNSSFQKRFSTPFIPSIQNIVCLEDTSVKMSNNSNPNKKITKKRKQRSKLPSGISSPMCFSCKKTKPTQWRRGSDNMLSLCNACGIRFANTIKKELKIPQRCTTHRVAIDNLVNKEKETTYNFSSSIHSGTKFGTSMFWITKKGMNVTPMELK
eukprot:TRINITY_DN3352_c0_g1_i3.p1 TRINITY_DN3352_c0_g1~~TRINITY_DN3352_c0_g1_i3.p1  ORF type:complete len:224 (+),score=49.89 TRINITY_DN3352_c0_g1_i3:900-1571(+)